MPVNTTVSGCELDGFGASVKTLTKNTPITECSLSVKTIAEGSKGLVNRKQPRYKIGHNDDDLSFENSCQVCSRTMRWQNGRSRRSRNLHTENAYQGSETKKDESAAHSIQARRSLLQQRPDTFAQTNSVTFIFPCNTARTIHFRVVDVNTGIPKLDLRPGEVLEFSLQCVPHRQTKGYAIRATQFALEGASRRTIGGQRSWPVKSKDSPPEGAVLFASLSTWPWMILPVLCTPRPAKQEKNESELRRRNALSPSARYRLTEA